MTDNNPRQGDGEQYGADRDSLNRDPLDHDGLERELDAALANYAAAEPRAGIEERILANLRVQDHAVRRPWWGWPAIGALAAVVVVVGLLLTVRFGKPATNVAGHHSPVFPAVTPPAAGSQSADNERPSGAAPALRKKPVRVAVQYPENENASAPKLEVFPSPQPLSEQEKMLVAYVAQHRQQAVLIAQARMVELKEDLAKEAAEQNAERDRQPSDQSMTR